MSNIKIIDFVCDETDRHSDNFKIITIIIWKNSRNVTIAKTFMKICIYYRIWIESDVVIIEFICRLLRKNKSFVWNNKQEEVMYFLKILLICVFVLRTIDYFENVDNIILTVNVSNSKWKAMLMQKDKNKKHSNKYKSELWTNVEKKYDLRKRKCRKLLTVFKKKLDFDYTKFVLLWKSKSILSWFK